MSEAPTDKIAAVVSSARKAKRSAPAKEDARRELMDTPYDLSYPEDCPVEPLGVNGDEAYFLDAKRQLRVFKAKELNRGVIVTLFGDQQDLKFTYWPRYGKYNEETGECPLVGWRPEQAGESLYQEAARKGLIDVLDRVRGPGAWRDEDDKLVYHCGDVLYHDGGALTPRQIGRHVYPSAPPKPKPKTENVHGIEEAQELLSLLRSWSWRRSEIDPVLLMGWVGAAILGGALDWRPLIWITGDKATGKSTLHAVVKDVLGPGGLIAAADASAAGLWQTVGHASLPVALDELEAEADNRKAAAIIKLARIAASGHQMMRGGSDHKSASFTVRSCFLFSSILIPPTLGQDVSRMAILQLQELGVDAKSPAINSKRLSEIGAILRGRLLTQWHRYERVLSIYKDALSKVGHGGRGGDLFGTLLTCYELLINDGDPCEQDINLWASMLQKSTLAEGEGDVANHERCISYLMTSQLDAYRAGERRTIGSWVAQAAGRAIDGGHADEHEIRDAKRALGNIGLIVQDKKNADGKTVKVLQVANEHQGLAQVFKDSLWASAAGTDGVWMQAIRRVAGAVPDQQRFSGVKKRCTAVPLASFLEGHDETE